MTTATTESPPREAPLALDFVSICEVASGGTRTPDYDRTLMALCQMLAAAIALDDPHQQRDAMYLIRTLTERANYQDWAR